MRITIDRFEGSFAVCEAENNEMLSLPLFLFPKDINEGDILNIIIKKDNTETGKLKKEIEHKMKELWED